MKTKKQLQNENKLLKAKLLIKEHEKKYIHIPFSWGFISRLFAFLGSVVLVMCNFFLLISVWTTYNISVFFGTNEEIIANKALISFKQLVILYPVFGEYILIGLSMICLVALIKGGFDKLKRYDEDGLIIGLIFGLIVGLTGSLIGGLSEEFN